MMTRRLAFALSALALLPRPAFAGDSPPARIEETVVTPSRRTAPALSLPYRVGTVEEEDLSGPLAPRSLTDAVAEIPGVMPQKTGHGQGSPFLRGLTGFRTLLLVDGVRLNNSVFRDGPNQYLSTVDNLALRRMEMVGGPAAVMYGSDALGGTLNLLPRRPVFEDGACAFGGRAYQRLATAEGGGVSRLEAQGGLGGDFGFLFGIDRKSFHDLRDGDGRLPYTGYDEWDADLRCLYDPAEGLRLTFGFERVSQDDVPRTHKTMHAVPFHGTTVGSDRVHEYDQMRSLAYARAEALEPIAFVEELRARVSWQRQREVRDRVRKDRRRDHQGFSVDTLGLDGAAVSTSAIGTLTYGIDWYHDFVDSSAENFNANGDLTSRGIQGPVADDASYDLAGVFLQDEIDAGSGFVATFGARGTYAHTHAAQVLNPETNDETHLSDHWAALAGSARLSYFASEETTLYAGVSQGFRAPNLSDLTRYDVARTNEIEVPNAGLDPERAVAFELGAKTAGEVFRGEVGVFHTILSDFIQRRPTDREIDGDVVVEKSNCGDGAVRGIEASGEVDAGGGVSVFAGVSYFYGKIDSYARPDSRLDRDFLDRLQPLMGRAGVRWEPVRGLVLGARARLAARADRLSPGDRQDTERIPPSGTRGYAVFDLEVSWQPVEALTVSLALENLGNETWRVHGSGVNEPGRNLVLTLEARW